MYQKPHQMVVANIVKENDEIQFLFGAHHLHEKGRLLPLRLGSFRTYASSTLLPAHLHAVLPGNN